MQPAKRVVIRKLPSMIVMTRRVTLNNVFIDLLPLWCWLKSIFRLSQLPPVLDVLLLVYHGECVANQFLLVFAVVRYPGLFGVRPSECFSRNATLSVSGY